jgi:hypothetical protein
VAMRAEVFGLVGRVSRMAEGEDREAHLIKEDEVGGEGGRCLAELGECVFRVEGVAGLGVGVSA